MAKQLEDEQAALREIRRAKLTTDPVFPLYVFTPANVIGPKRPSPVQLRKTLIINRLGGGFVFRHDDKTVELRDYSRNFRIVTRT